MTQIPAFPFYSTQAERVEMARRRYFDEGLPPSGVVSDAVFQSWARCQRLHARPSAEVVFQPVTASRTHLALQRNRSLHEAWLEELPQLQAILGTTSCAAMLTDATGVMIGASCAGRSHEQLMPVATRIGVNLSEEVVGTTAPGGVARTGQPVCVQGAEHFFDGVRAMHCAAAPIRDVQGRLAGVLDISSESIPFSFDVASVVGLYAGAIENRLLIAQAGEHLILRLQVAPSLLDSPMAGLIGIDTAGRLVWRNAVASRLLGLPPAQQHDACASVETALGARISELAALPRSEAAALKLPNGLMVWARSEMRAPDGHRQVVPAFPVAQPIGPVTQTASESVPTEAEAAADPSASPSRAMAPAESLTTLRDSDRDLIARALSDCGGNVSKAADALEARTPAFIEAMAAEVGASALWAGLNVYLAANLFREAASLATQIQGETIPTDKPGALSMTVRQPVGVVLSIVPWNGPVVLAARAIAYPIVCGNTVVFRASESSPKTHMLVAEALVEAGLPAGVLNFLTNAPQDAPEVIDALIAHKAVRRINFTGTTRVGRIIAQKAATHLKRCLLELGGKSPLVVLDDANVDEAVKAAVFGSFLYQGQICMSTERIVVDESIADEFVAKFAARARELPCGDPMTNPGCVIGPMIVKESGARLNAMIDDALGKGAQLACGGRADGAVMPATIVDHVKPGMKIYDEETFGPVTTVVRVQGVDAAIATANDTAYGLSSGVFGRDVTRALAVAMELDYGSVHVNGATVQNEAQAPYGGTKDSGYGRFDGRAVIDEFTELKWLTIEPSVQQYPV